MVHSHHTHSGEYVAHAIDALDDMVALAYLKGFTTFCLTEHMPRLEYLYPEEEERDYTVQTLAQKFDDYVNHATLLKHTYEGKMSILVGFEVEGINADHLSLARSLLSNSKIDMCVGSIHFVNEIPIDFDRELWVKARDSCGDVRLLYKTYFETQYKMLEAINPQVVGHFDLIRLYDDAPHDLKQWPEVWSQIQKNIDLINEQGGCVEFNSSALRKGWETPYPQADIAEEIKNRGGRFCLSDDCHSLKQVGLNYDRVLAYINRLKIETVYELQPSGKFKAVPVREVLETFHHHAKQSDAYTKFQSKTFV
ncbi:hypothetical protein DICA1_E22562 [Diutina catenulata]